jgi:phosphoglycolate phosphatase
MNIDKNLKDYALVIFDWDGTLMDSISRIVSSMQSAARHCELIVPSKEEARSIIGLSLAVGIKKLFPALCDKGLDNMITQYKYQYLEGDTTPSPLFENSLNLLTALKSDQRKLAVATGKARPGLQRMFELTDTEHYFDASCCADEVLSKPAPDMLLRLLAELDISADQAVMIGDTSYDMQMAKSAGVDRIGITLGVDKRATLNEYQPVAVVDSISELQQLLLPK